MEYGNMHRHFLRTMMSNGVMSEREAQKLLHDNEVANVIFSINAEIRPLSQELKQIQNETTGERQIVILWTGIGPAALAQNQYSEAEVLYWRNLMHQIVSAEGKKINGIRAMNLDNKLQKSRIQDLLSEWTAAHYLVEDESGDYTLGPRGIHEFEAYLRQHLSDALDICLLCKKPVYQSVNCDHCGQYFHSYCLRISLARMDKWPCCKETNTS